MLRLKKEGIRGVLILLFILNSALAQDIQYAFYSKKTGKTIAIGLKEGKLFVVGDTIEVLKSFEENSRSLLLRYIAASAVIDKVDWKEYELFLRKRKKPVKDIKDCLKRYTSL